MPTKKGQELNEQFVQFANQKKILIVDFSQTSRTSVSHLMNSLGVKQASTLLASNFETAEELINEKKPGIVIADYDLGKKCGLELLQRVRINNPDLKNSVFVILTGNTSQSAVAKSAEEDVDAFIIKPFTPEVLRNSILKAAISKINPPPYLKKIEEGKILLKEGKLDDAIKEFEEAKKLNEAPSLALGYIGQANMIKKIFESAEINYEDGLKYNKIHYKCLAGLYDVMIEQKKHKQAYDVIKKIAQYFPANPQRLSSVLRLAILNSSYEDIEKYYQLFLSIDERNAEMIKYVCAALVVCGKYYLQRNSLARALELFQKAAITGSGKPKILKEIVLSLIDAKQEKKAAEFLKRFPPESRKTQEYLISELVVSERTLNVGLTLDSAKKLYQQGIKDPLLYKVMIRCYLEAGHRPSAEDLVVQAKKDYPNENFDSLLTP